MAGKRSDATDAWTLGDVSGLGETEMLALFAERGGDPARAGKRHALDPLLWRVAREGEPRWPGATLGDGRPGWHIECTVIAQKYLPAPFTVQGGGSDLVFPHHEMGAGHAYSLSGVPLARHYSHAGMVGLDGEKMSKSKGNLVLVSKLRAAGEEPAAIRLAILANHYRSDWSWTDEEFAAAKERLARWREAAERPRQVRQDRWWPRCVRSWPMTSTLLEPFPQSIVGQKTTLRTEAPASRSGQCRDLRRHQCFARGDERAESKEHTRTQNTATALT